MVSGIQICLLLVNKISNQTLPFTGIVPLRIIVERVLFTTPQTPFDVQGLSSILAVITRIDENT